jgi:AcrR family transcriptional regulator
VDHDAAVRRRPAQARSQARFDQILAAAAELIGERGIEPVTMTDIAERAGMALTAVYRYFPNKQAVVRELALQTFAHDTDTMFAMDPGLDRTPDELIAAGVDEFRRRHVAEPFRLQLRAAIHADAELSALDLAESRRNARTIAELVAGATGRTDQVALERQALLVVELIDSLMRLVTRVEPDEADALVAEFAAMATRALAPPRPSAPDRVARASNRSRQATR